MTPALKQLYVRLRTEEEQHVGHVCVDGNNFYYTNNKFR